MSVPCSGDVDIRSEYDRLISPILMNLVQWRAGGDEQGPSLVAAQDCRVRGVAAGVDMVHDASALRKTPHSRTGGVSDPQLKRQFLHAWRLAFPHPLTGESVEVESPLPLELQAALERFDS